MILTLVFVVTLSVSASASFIPSITDSSMFQLDTYTSFFGDNFHLRNSSNFNVNRNLSLTKQENGNLMDLAILDGEIFFANTPNNIDLYLSYLLEFENLTSENNMENELAINFNHKEKLDFNGVYTGLKVKLGGRNFKVFEDEEVETIEEIVENFVKVSPYLNYSTDLFYNLAEVGSKNSYQLDLNNDGELSNTFIINPYLEFEEPLTQEFSWGVNSDLKLEYENDLKYTFNFKPFVNNKVEISDAWNFNSKFYLESSFDGSLDSSLQLEGSLDFNY